MIKIFTEASIAVDLEASRALLPPDAPIAVILRTSDDHNGLFNIQTDKYARKILALIAEGYQVYDYKMPDGNVDGALERLGLKDKSVSILYIAAHGNRASTHFAKGAPGKLRAKRIKKLRLKSLTETAHICFDSCIAGISMAPAFQRRMPDAKVWAVDVNISACHYLSGPVPRFFFKDTLGNPIISAEIEESEARAIMSAGWTYMSDIEEIRPYAEAGDVDAQVLVGLGFDKRSPERLEWLNLAYKGAGIKGFEIEYIQELFSQGKEEEGRGFLLEILKKGDLLKYQEMCDEGYSLTLDELKANIDNPYVREAYLKRLSKEEGEISDREEVVALLVEAVTGGSVFKKGLLERIVQKLAVELASYIDHLRRASASNLEALKCVQAYEKCLS